MGFALADELLRASKQLKQMRNGSEGSKIRSGWPASGCGGELARLVEEISKRALELASLADKKKELTEQVRGLEPVVGGLRA